MSRGMGVNARQWSSTSSLDVGNPPTEEGHPGNVKTEQGEKRPPSHRPEKDQTPSTLDKEYSVRDLFHDKARETEERLLQEGKVPEAQVTKK